MLLTTVSQCASWLEVIGGNAPVVSPSSLAPLFKLAGKRKSGEESMNDWIVWIRCVKMIGLSIQCSSLQLDDFFELHIRRLGIK